MRIDLDEIIKKESAEHPDLNHNQLAQIIFDTYPKLGIAQITIYYHVKRVRESGGDRNWKDLAQSDIKVRKIKVKHDEAENKYNALMKEYEVLEEKFNTLLEIKTEAPKPMPITAQPLTKSEATAIVQYSDWHIEEEVKESQTDGMNKYNLDIAQKRASAVFTNTLRLIAKERQEIKIPNIIIHLGGDFITGWIHEEGQQTNLLSPIEATIVARDMLYAGISKIATEGKFKRIIVLCNRGNHARTTKRMQFTNEISTSYETFIYHDLKSRFHNIEFVIPDSDIGYFEVYGKVIRFYHGQQVKYNRGVGGITPSLNRIQAGWDKTKDADYNLMGHYHTWSFPNPYTTLNGSMIGFNVFAKSFGFGFEQPLQSFQLLDVKRGFTVRTPILCD